MSVRAKDKIAILGPNGCGKSTLFRAILEKELLSKGLIERRTPIEKIGYIPQDYRKALFPWLSLRENLKLYRRAMETDCAEKFEADIMSGLERFEISFNIDKYPYQLSGGEQQILLIVAILARSPNLILLDEPFSAIDMTRKAEARKFVSEKLTAIGCTMLMITHDHMDASSLCDTIMLLTGSTPNKVQYVSAKDFRQLSDSPYV